MRVYYNKETKSVNHVSSRIDGTTPSGKDVCPEHTGDKDDCPCCFAVENVQAVIDEPQMYWVDDRKKPYKLVRKALLTIKMESNKKPVQANNPPYKYEMNMSDKTAEITVSFWNKDKKVKPTGNLMVTPKRGVVRNRRIKLDGKKDKITFTWECVQETINVRIRAYIEEMTPLNGSDKEYIAPRSTIIMSLM